MYIVIFNITFKEGMWQDPQYLHHSGRTNDAINDLDGFIKVVDFREGRKAVSISYWKSMDVIHEWAKHPLHVEAKKFGMEFAYEDYSIEISKTIG